MQHQGAGGTALWVGGQVVAQLRVVLVASSLVCMVAYVLTYIWV